MTTHELLDNLVEDANNILEEAGDGVLDRSQLNRLTEIAKGMDRICREALSVLPD